MTKENTVAQQIFYIEEQLEVAYKWLDAEEETNGQSEEYHTMLKEVMKLEEKVHELEDQLEYVSWQE